jgi:hypothetical protein
LWYSILSFGIITSVFHCRYFSIVTLLLLLPCKCQSNILYSSFNSRLTSHTDTTLLPFIALLYQIFSIQTHNIIPVLHSLSQVYTSIIDCHVPSWQIPWLHNSVYPLVSCKLWYELYLCLSMPHSVSSTPQFDALYSRC